MPSAGSGHYNSSNAKNEEYLKILRQYDRLDWKYLPLIGKKPYWDKWSSPERWTSGEYNNERSKREILAKKTNVGILTGEINNIIAIDVDQPALLEWKPDYAIEHGALAHTTSKALRLILYSDNPEVLAFSKKLTKKWTELTEEEKAMVINREKYEQAYEDIKEKLERGDITREEFNRRVPTVTIIEILGNGRQFVAPPSIHPEKRVEFKWVTPLPDSADKILKIKSLKDLFKLLLKCCKNKEYVLELFKGTDVVKEDKTPEYILKEWLKVILKHLEVVRESDSYILCRCPFHPPDEHPSFAIYTNTYLAVDFHDEEVYILKDLAKKLGIKLPHDKNKRPNVVSISLRYKEHDFGILKIEKFDKNKLVVTVVKDGKIIVPSRIVSDSFVLQPRVSDQIFRFIKNKLSKEEFNEFFGKLQQIILRKIQYLKLNVQTTDEEEIDTSTFDLETLRNTFGIEDEEEAKEVFIELFIENESGKIEESHARIAEFLMSKFYFKTLRESEEVFYYENGVYKPNGEKVIKELVQKLLKAFNVENLARKRFIDEIVEYIKRSTYVSIRQFREFDEKELVNLKNGVLDLNTMELKPHSPEYLFLWQLPVEYKPDADCPKIKKFLSEIVSPEDIDTLIKIPAYCLMPGQPYQVAFYLYGPTGSNGKSTYANLLIAFLGKENVAAESLENLETNRFATYSLFGKLANIYGENPERAVDSLNSFKRITGYDLVDIEKKFKDRFKAHLRCKLIFYGNKLPKIKDLDHPTLRRWVIVIFPNKFKNNPNLIKELTTPEELSGFLNLVLKAYKDLKKNGFRKKTIEETRLIWIRNADPIYAFVLEHVHQVEDSYVRKDDIWEAFYSYCVTYNIPFPYKGTGARKIFFKELYDRLRTLNINFEVKYWTLDDVDRREWIITGIELKDLEKLKESKVSQSSGRDDLRESENDGDNDQTECLVDSFDISNALGLDNPNEELLNDVFGEDTPPKKSQENVIVEDLNPSKKLDTKNELIEEPSDETKEIAKLYGLKTVNTKLNVFDNEQQNTIKNKNNSKTATLNPVFKLKRAKVDEKGYATYWDYDCPFIGSFCNGLRICHLRKDNVIKEECENCPIPNKEYLKVEFLKDCIEFTGADGVNYGPFSKGDIVELHILDVLPLLKADCVRVIDEGGDYS